MCGITGIYSSKGLPIDRETLRGMTDQLAHRGPDGEGFHVAAGIGLGHRRLSIIDLGGGAQPISNEDGSIVIVFNGEIYNFIELRDELLRQGHRFKTHSDTEVIVHAYEQWGPDCTCRFNGIFAFALWIRTRGRCFWPAIIWELSRCTMSNWAIACCLLPRSRRCWPIRNVLEKWIISL